MSEPKPKVVHPENVMPFIPPGYEDLYASRMLIDAFNCGSDKLQVNHGVVKAGKRLPGGAHEGHDELYIVLSGHAKLDMTAEQHVLNPGTVVYIPAGTFHAIRSEKRHEDLVLITVWPGQPAPGANEVYDMRQAAWGTTYREIEAQGEV